MTMSARGRRRLDRVLVRLDRTVQLLLKRGPTTTRPRDDDPVVEVETDLQLRTPEIRRLRQWCVATPGVSIEWSPRGDLRSGARRLRFSIRLAEDVVGPGCLRPFLLGLRQLEGLRKLEIELEETNRGILALYRETLSQRLQAGEAGRRLADLNARKDEFLAMLAHELRNPLAAIAAAADELRDADSAESTAPLVGVVERQTVLLQRLVDDLLDVSRVTRGRLVLSTAQVDLRDALRDAHHTLEHAARKKRVRLDVHLDATPALVRGDADRLVQIAVNLLDNAIKYTPTGGVVEAWVEARDDEAQLVVVDSGRGFNPVEADRLFELFVQDTEGGEAPHGLGLGLTLVRSLVRLHGGRITANSPGEGRGSSFVATFPRMDDEPAEDRAATARPRPHTPPPLEQQAVLLVEDNDDLRTLFASGLRRYFARVDEAASGLEALAALRDEHDVVLLDLGLPGLDGYEVARRMRAAGTRARLVALTGHGSESDRSKTVAAGFDLHLVKPLRAAAVAALLTEGAHD